MTGTYTHSLHRLSIRLALTLVVAMGALLMFHGTAQAAAIQAEAGCAANTLAANDDGSTGQITLPFTVNFYGTNYASLWVNNNGNVTFTGPLGTFTPAPIVTNGTPIIAPFWADVDTRAVGSSLVTYGAVADYNGTGHQAFCVMWNGVGYFSAHADKLNRFQLLLVDQSTSTNGFDIIFNYDQVQWETGDASGGVNGLGGSSARAGFTGGVSSFELPGSGVNGAFLDAGPSALATNSSGSAVPGRYIYQVRNTPGAPLAFTATPGNGKVDLSWSAPPYPGSSPIDHYVLTYSPAGGTPATPVTIAAGATTATITGLTNGTQYTFNLVAVNTAGSGTAATAQTTPFVPDQPPTAPTNVHATAGNASAVVTWSPATVLPGSSPIQSYTVTCQGEGGTTGSMTTGADATTATVNLLTNGVLYTCQVYATNNAGNGPPGTSNSFTPTANQSATVIQPGVTNTLVTNNAQQPDATTTTVSKFNLPPTNDPNIVGKPAEIDTFIGTASTVCAPPETCFGRVTHYNIPSGYGTGTNGPIKVTLVYDKTVVPFARLLNLRWWEIRTVGDVPNGALKRATQLPFCRLGRYNGTTCVIIWTVLPFARTVDGVHAGPFDLVAQFWFKTTDDPFIKGH